MHENDRKVYKGRRETKLYKVRWTLWWLGHPTHKRYKDWAMSQYIHSLLGVVHGCNTQFGNSTKPGFQFLIKTELVILLLIIII